MKTKAKKQPPTFAPLPSGAVVLALDISSSVTGWAAGYMGDDGKPVVLNFGIIKPPSGWDSVRRVDRMRTEIASIVDQHDPLEICLEWQSSKSTGKRIQGLAVLGQAQGAIRSYLCDTHRTSLVDERTWTRVSGRNAKKEVRCEIVKETVPAYAARLKENPKFDAGMDGADAIGILIYRLSR